MLGDTLVPLSDATLEFGEELATVTLGIDALDRKLYQTDDDYDGVACINLGWDKSATYADWDEARAALDELAAKALTLPEPDRRLYYSQACISLDSFCAWRQGKLERLTDQVSLFLLSDGAPMSEAYMVNQCKRLDQYFDLLGYKGDLMERTQRWQEENAVPRDEVQSTMTELMGTAREITGTFLPLPEEPYKVATVDGGPFSARSEVMNLQVVINIAPIYTRPALKHLVCHEIYPGHYMQFYLRRELWKQGFAAADGLLSVTNHSSSSCFEGLADKGGQFLGWTDTNDRIFEIYSDIKNAIGTLSSYQLHVLGWPEEKVEDYMRQWPLLGGEAAIKSRMEFINDTTRAALIWSYWRGDQAFDNVLCRLSDEDMPRFYEYIYGRLHTPSSLALFI